ncbi:MAG: hypothetical protein F4051_15325 [Boseongicola sp. SB0670_bin_30]|nr:hypothetical protein [Boseongicola sp. SB0670_bin_30]
MKALAFGTAILASMALASSATAETSIVYGSWAPSTDPASLAMDTFAAEVGERSDGRISFETHYDSSVVQMRTVLGGIGDGLVDAGYVAGAIYQAEMPIDSMITQYASLKANPYSISAAVTDVVLNDCPECVAEAEAHGVKPLAYAGTPHFYLMCKNPISSFDELRGKSIRAASANLRLVERMGGTPVNTPTVEVLEAISRGQVECVIGSVFWLQAYSLWDVVGHVVDLPVGQYNNGLVFGVNAGFWGDLSDEDRATISGSLPTLIANAAANGVAKAHDVRRMSEEKGVVWGEPTDEMRQFMEDWFASERAVVQAWGEGKGIDSSGAILDKIEAALEKWNGIVDAAGGDEAEVREAIAAEIYSRL